MSSSETNDPQEPEQEDCKSFSLGKFYRDAMEGDSIFGSSWNLANGIIGTGVFFLPFTLKDMGVIPGFSFLMIGAVVLTIAVYILLGALNASRNSKDLKTPPNSMEDLAKFAFRKNNFLSVSSWLFVKFVTFLHGFMNQLAYQIVFCQLLMKIIRLLMNYDDASIPGTICDFENIWSRSIICFIVVLGLNVFGLLERVRSLRIISLISLTTDFFILVVMIVLLVAGFSSSLSSGEVAWFPKYEGYKTILNLSKYGGKLCFTYMTLSLPKIHSVFRKKNLHRLSVSIYNSHTMVFMFYSSIAIIGYFSFLDNTKEHVLLNYAGDSRFAVFISVLLQGMTFLQIFLSYPVWNYVLIVAMDDLSVSGYECFIKMGKNAIEAAKNQKTVTTKVTTETFVKNGDDDEYRKVDSSFSSDHEVIGEITTTTTTTTTTTEESDQSMEEGGEFLDESSSNYETEDDEEKREPNLIGEGRVEEDEDDGEEFSDDEEEEFQSVALKAFFNRHQKRRKKKKELEQRQYKQEIKRMEERKKEKMCSTRYLRFIIISTLINFAVMIIAIIYPKAHHVIGYAGGVPGTLYVFIIPPILYLQLKKTSRWVKLVLILFLIITALFSGLIPTVIMILNEFGIGM